MKCVTCGNDKATHIRIRYDEEGQKTEVCDRCAELNISGIADVYCPQGGYFDENLCDSKHRKGQWVSSKAHKSALLKQLKLEEAGSNRNDVTGKVIPFIKDPQKRRKYFIDNFGG